jgi:plasmid stabilization system protein ParE
MTDTDYPERTYAVRVSENFADQTKSNYLWMERGDPEKADNWLAELQKAKASLATLPQRCPVAEENRMYQKKNPGPPLRVSLYRHGQSTWRILFTIHEAEGGDQAYVKLHQLRNAVQKPLAKWPDEN